MSGHGRRVWCRFRSAASRHSMPYSAGQASAVPELRDHRRRWATAIDHRARRPLLMASDVRSGYLQELHRHLGAGADRRRAGRLDYDCMELTPPARASFIYVPLRHHFEQNFHVRHRLAPYGAGHCLEYDDATPDGLAARDRAQIGREVSYRPVETDGAARAAASLAAPSDSRRAASASPRRVAARAYGLAARRVQLLLGQLAVAAPISAVPSTTSASASGGIQGVRSATASSGFRPTGRAQPLVGSARPGRPTDRPRSLASRRRCCWPPGPACRTRAPAAQPSQSPQPAAPGSAVHVPPRRPVPLLQGRSRAGR